MKRLVSLAMLVTACLWLSACQSENPVEQSVSSQTDAAAKPQWVKAAEAQGLKIIELPKSENYASLDRLVYFSRYCDATQLNTLNISYRIQTGYTRYVNVRASIQVPKGALPKSDYLTMQFSQEYLSTGVDLTFGPHGTNFLTPALLNVEATGLDLRGWNPDDRIDLYYYNQVLGVWEKMETERIYLDVRNGIFRCINGKLPHFSRYGFTRYCGM